MENERDRFGEKMRLVERAKEDIYFAAKDRELIEKLKGRLRKVEREGELACPKCSGKLESYLFMEIALERCQGCGGVWLDKGEMETILKKAVRSPLGELLHQFVGKDDHT